MVPLRVVPNPTFQLALDYYIEQLSTKEHRAFNDANNMSMDLLMRQVRACDEAHQQASVCCTEKIEGFMTSLCGYLEHLSSLILRQEPQIKSLIMGGISLAIDLGLRFTAVFIKVTNMLKILGGHLDYLSKHILEVTDSPEVQKILSHVYGDLLEFCRGVRGVFTDNDGNPYSCTSFRVFLRTKWEPFEAIFDCINHRFLENLEIVTPADCIIDPERLHLRKTLEAQKNEEKKKEKLQHWLSKLEFENDHDILYSKRHGNTGDWLVESDSFKNWLENQGSCILWCFGNHGIGKSVLASLVVEKLSVKYSLDDRIGLAFFYYKHQNSAGQSSKTILATLIKQLIQRKKILPAPLKKFHGRYSSEDGLPSNAKLQAQLVEVSKTFDKVIIVIDALDEFQDQDQDPFIPLIKSLCLNLGLNIKVFVTSTREKSIEESFQALICPVVKINIERIRPDLDIADFVASEVDRRSEGYVHGVIDQKIKERIKASLVSRSCGRFLWVNFQLMYLYSQPSLKDIESALCSLPSDMGPTYDCCFKKIEAEIPALSKLAKRALTWVLFAARPLSLELVHVITIEESIKSKTQTVPYRYGGYTILESCANLITIEGGVVRPVHHTIQYLTLPTACIEEVRSEALQSYRVLGHNAHAELAQACLQYLLLDEFQQLFRPFTWKNAISPHPNWFREDKLLQYAVHYWDYHIRKVVEWPEFLVHSFKRFLSTQSIIAFVYKIRTAKSTRLKLGLLHDLAGRDRIDGFTLCLWLGLLKVYEKFNKMNVSMEEYTSLMHQAALSGSLDSIEMLLGMGLSANSQNPNEIQPLYCACEIDDEAVVKLLLERGAEPDARGGFHETALQAASYNGNMGAVKALLEKGAEVNIQGGYYGNSLQAAAFDGDEMVVKTLIEKGAEVNAQGGFYGNALQAAAYNGDETIVNILLERGAEVNAQGGHYGNALQAAANHGSDIVVRTLLDRGAEINVQGGLRGNALQAASLSGKEGVVMLLLDRGAEVNAHGGNFGSALQAASYSGNNALVNILLKKGANINAQGGLRGNALQAAAFVGHEMILKTLLEKGAEVNTRSGEYGNALQAAAYNGNKTVANILLEKGAKVNFQGGDYGNALQAAAWGGNETLVDFLLERGADVNAQGGRYRSALQAAAFSGNETIVKTLLERGAEINSSGGEFGAPLQAAVFSRNESLVDMLLEKGADVNITGGFGGSALQAAAINGNETMVKKLLEKGADVNAEGGTFGSALQAAAAYGHEMVVKALIDKGANINAQGGLRGTALQAAAIAGDEIVVKLLLEKGADSSLGTEQATTQSKKFIESTKKRIAADL